MTQESALTNQTPRIVVIDDGMPAWTRLSERLSAAGIIGEWSMHQEVAINPFDMTIDIDGPSSNS